MTDLPDIPRGFRRITEAEHLRRRDKHLIDFIRESNRIEGIIREPHKHEIDIHYNLLRACVLTTALLESFVSIIQPGARLRDQPGLNVRVGRHVAPPGDPTIREHLDNLLRWSTESIDAFKVHREYLNLHPFTDGNGRSSRLLWLRMMGGPENVPLGFLQHWYYQSLEDGDRVCKR